MLLDGDQRAAVRSEISVAVQAGPGSGKTRTLVAKALREAARLRGTSLQVACITMSRTATSVIETRIRSFASEEDEARIFVGTIHAFCLQAIFQPFHRFVSAYRDGWQVIAADQEAYRDYAIEVFGDRAKPVLKHLPYVRRNQFGEPENLGGLRGRDISRFWEALEHDHFVDFPSLLYRSIQILREQDDVAEFIGSRYRWILIDEFQDTTNMQLDILAETNRGNTAYFIVGDKNQAIYSFAGASPSAQQQFVEQLGVRETVTLSRNYRSSDRICDAANVIIDTNMRSYRTEAGIMPTVRHSESKKYAALAQAIRRHFLSEVDARGVARNKAAIIAPNSYVAADLVRELSNLGIPCARSDAALEQEPLLRLVRGMSEYVAGQNLVGSRYAGEIIEAMLTAGEPPGWLVDDFGAKVLTFSMLEWFGRAISDEPTWRDLLTSLADTLVSLACDLGVAARTWCEPVVQARRVLEEAAKTEQRFHSDAYRLYSEAVLVTWIFRSKGLEFDAVALVEVEDRAIPHYRSYESNNLDEERRKFFVSLTRAADILQMYSDRDNRSPYIDELLRATVLQGVGAPKRA